MPECFIAFGGNQGDVPATFHAAAAVLEREAGRMTRRSRLYRTAPVGVCAGDEYHNAVASIETDLSPDDLLTLVQRIEHDLGRIRGAHWGPRTLDLDLIAYGDLAQHSPRLTLPHPHCWYRRFVLDPWSDVAPDFIHPELGETVAGMGQRLLERPLPVAVVSVSPAVREEIGRLDGITLVDPAATAPAIRLSDRTNPAERTVAITSIEDSTAYASQILRAALDEPIHISDQAWVPI
jgi:2-amino-4-hydroxy-6-hydroxymethyldihydropteridine diphosphokinase